MGYALVGTALLEEHIQTKNRIPPEQISYYLSIVITLLPLGAIIGNFFLKKGPYFRLKWSTFSEKKTA